MSESHAIATHSTSNFISIFEAASKEYKILTKEDLNTHTFFVQLDSCDSPDAVLRLAILPAKDIFTGAGVFLTAVSQSIDNDVRGIRGNRHNLYTKHLDGSDQSSEATLVQCLKHMLQSAACASFYIILDALDKCPDTLAGTPSPREKVLNFVEYICALQVVQPEQDIRMVLDPLTSTSLHVSLHEEGGQREDIDTYIRSFVKTDRAMQRWRVEESNWQ
ncbi:hypothetical protein V8E53_002434 [Lactarius tabidus]